MRTLKTEVEKGFLRTAFGQELVGPKRQGNPVIKYTIKLLLLLLLLLLLYIYKNKNKKKKKKVSPIERETG